MNEGMRTHGRTKPTLGTDPLISMLEQISLKLDEVTRAALRVLTADGTDAADAVRTAIRNAADRCPEPPPADSQPPGEGDRYAEHISAQIAAAPPLTDYQVYMVTAAFVERRDVWLSEEQWLAERDAAADHRSE